MYKYGLAVVFLVLFQSFAFAQSPKGGGGTLSRLRLSD